MRRLAVAPASALALAGVRSARPAGPARPPALRSIQDLEDGSLVYSRGGQVYVVDDGTLRRSELSIEEAKLRGALPLPRTRA